MATDSHHDAGSAFYKIMKSTLESPATDRSPSAGYAYNGSTAWEYRFVLQEEWSPVGGGLTELAPEGWVVVSFRTRLDNRREYLLKRPRR
jgi:hypothetical protein